jgi:hypothetical protein
MGRKTLTTEAVNRWGERCFKPYPNGLVPNVQKGTGPAGYPSLARYGAKEVGSPPIAVRRIDR